MAKRAPIFVAPNPSGGSRLSSRASADKSGDFALGQGIAAVGGVLSDYLVTRDRKQTAIRANKKLASFKEGVAQASLESRKQAGPGAEGYTPLFMEQYDQTAQALLDSSENSNERALLETHLDDFRVSTFTNALDFESTAGVLQRKLDLQDAVDITANSVRVNPSQFEDGYSMQMAALNEIRTDLPPNDEMQMEEDIKQTLAISAIQGEIDLAPGLALDRLQKGHWDKFITPAQKNTLLNQASSGVNVVDRVARARLDSDINDHVASIQATGRGMVGVNDDRIDQVYTDEQDRTLQKEALHRGEAFANETYEIGSTIELGDPDQRKRVVDLLKDDVLAGGKGSVDNQALYDFSVNKYNETQRALVDDAAAYVIEKSLTVQAAFNRGTIPGVEASIAEQARLGIPEDVARILTNTQTASLVSDLGVGDPSSDLAKIDELRGVYTSKYFNKVMSELIGAGLDPLVAILDTVAINDPVAGVRAFAALRVKPADIQKQFNDSSTIPYSVLVEAAQDFTEPMRQAIAGHAPERLSYMSKVQDLVTRVAAVDAVQNGFDDPNESVEKAFNMLFGNHYQFENTYYLPHNDDEGKPYNIDQITTWTNKVLSSEQAVAKLGLAASAVNLSDGVPTAVSHDVTNLLFKHKGFWLNTEDGKGLQLWVDTPMGPGMAFKEGSQNPYIVSLRDIEKFRRFDEEAKKRTREISDTALKQVEEGVFPGVGNN